MLELWDGIVMDTAQNMKVLVRAALLCVACDIPAARKVCGFVGHAAYHGCSKCMLPFPTLAFGEKPDYTNTNESEWPPRNITEHKKSALAHKNSSTRAQQKLIERNSGVRYSILTELPYFNPPRMCIIDPMHNLLLGTSKHMIEVWKALNLVSDDSFATIQQRVDSFITPNDVGRIPSGSKIMSGFAGFTAEQWKNWTIFFSLFSLKGILPLEHYQCWQTYVNACYLFCRRSIKATEVAEAHQLIVDFYRSFLSLYENEWCTPNIHLHGHLKECINDYGPVYSFWLFAFERLNGILGSYHTNNRNISVQLMQHFTNSYHFSPCNWPQEYVQQFLPVLQKFSYSKGSLQQTNLETALASSLPTDIEPLPPLYEDAFTVPELAYLRESFSLDVFMLYKKTKALQLHNFIIGGKNSRHSRSSLVLTQCENENSPSLSEIHYFAECKFTAEPTTLWIAAVSTFEQHPYKDWFGMPVQVWTITPHTPSSLTFVPVSAIKSRVAYSRSTVNFGAGIGEETVYVVVPL